MFLYLCDCLTMFSFIRVCAVNRVLTTSGVTSRSLWKWNKPPTGIAKMDKIATSFYCYNPQFLVENKNLPPILALHPLYASKSIFFDIASMFAKQLKRPFFCIDMRYHGDSPVVASSAAGKDNKAILMVLSQDIINFMDEFSIPKAILVGYGFGARASLQCTLLNPSRVDRVVAIDFSQDGQQMYSKAFAKNLGYLQEVDTTDSSRGVSYVKLVMKEILRNHVKNPITLRYVLENIIAGKEGKYEWRFNARVLEQILAQWSHAKQIHYGSGHQSKLDIPLLNIITKGNFISSEDYLELKQHFRSAQVEHINSRMITSNNKQLIKTVEKFANS